MAVAIARADVHEVICGAARAKLLEPGAACSAVDITGAETLVNVGRGLANGALDKGVRFAQDHLRSEFAPVGLRSRETDCCGDPARDRALRTAASDSPRGSCRAALQPRPALAALLLRPTLPSPVGASARRDRRLVARCERPSCGPSAACGTGAPLVRRPPS